jgi:ferric-dicitrate binding protein FerR (iron transport regulator)
MSDDSSKPSDHDTERAMQSLFAQVRPRDLPPAAVEAEIRKALFAEWDAITGRRAFVRRALAATAAASILLAVFGALLLRTGSAPAAVVASVERVRGDAQIGGAAPTIGAAVTSAVRIDTHSGQVALRLADGGSLRLASQTRVTFAAAGRATLDAGTLYFDSENGAAPVEVRTPLGTVRDIGTQFVARLAGERLDVAVRDGRVAIDRGSSAVDVVAGERVSVTSGSSAPRRERSPSFGADWNWAERLAPRFDTDGRRLIDFLQWVEAQTGRTLEFPDPNTEQAARDAVQHGSIDGEPLQMLGDVLKSNDLGYSLEGDRIVIRAATK